MKIQFKFLKSISSYAGFFLVFALQFFAKAGATPVYVYKGKTYPQKTVSQNYISNGDIVKEIEKSLIFSEESRQQINFYSDSAQKKKSDLTYNRGKKDDENYDQNSPVKITVSKSKVNSLDIAEKEKLAYNAATIGQYEVAIYLYKQVLESDPENIYAKFSLAVVYQKIGQLRQAKTLYYQLLKNSPDNQDEIVGNLLAILIEESPRDAVYLLSRLSAQNPKSSNILAHAAIAYDKIGDYNQAIVLLRQAATLNPDNIFYKYNLAVIFDKTEQHDKALYYYSEVVKNYNDSNSSEIASLEQIKQRIEYIRNKL